MSTLRALVCYLALAGVAAGQQLRFDDVIRNLRNPDVKVRLSAVELLHDAKYPEAIAPIAPLINDPVDEVQLAAIQAEMSFGRIHDTRAVAALTEQFKYYGKGEGAWSALEALARIADPSSVPLFKERLADKDPYLRRAAAEGLGRAGDASVAGELSGAATTDPSDMVRVAMAFALQKLGQNYAQRMVDGMTSSRVIPQVQEYLLELGPPIVPAILPFLQEPDPSMRAAIADVLGIIGGDAAVAPLQAAAQDRDPDVAAAAKRALDRLKLNSPARG
jgi:HEAT repeat protein